MTKAEELIYYKEFVRQQLSKLRTLMQKYASGDFSEKISLPKEENEFTQLFVGLNLMVDTIKELMEDKETTMRKLKTTEKN